MNKKLAPAILLALPLVSLTGPAFAADAAPADTGSSVVLQVNEKKNEKTVVKTEKVEDATKKIAETEAKAAEKVAETEAKAAEHAAKGNEKAALKAAEKVAKTKEKAAEKVAKTKEKAGIKDEAPVETPVETPVVTPKTVTVSFIDLLNNEKMVFANGGSPVLTVTTGDEKVVYEDTDLNGVYGDEEGKAISLTAESVLTVNLPDGSLLDLVSYQDVDGETKEVPLDNILNFDYESLKDGENALTVYAEFPPEDDGWDIPVMTMAALSGDTEEGDAFDNAPVRTDNATAVAPTKVTPQATEDSTPETGAAATSSEGAAAESDEYDLQIDLTEPVDEANAAADATEKATESNLEGAELTIDDTAPTAEEDITVVEEDGSVESVIVGAEEDTDVAVVEDGEVVAEGPAAALADTGAGAAAAGFGGLLAALGAGSLLFRRKKSPTDA